MIPDADEVAARIQELEDYLAPLIQELEDYLAPFFEGTDLMPRVNLRHIRPKGNKVLKAGSGNVTVAGGAADLTPSSPHLVLQAGSGNVTVAGGSANLSVSAAPAVLVAGSGTVTAVGGIADLIYSGGVAPNSAPTITGVINQTVAEGGRVVIPFNVTEPDNDPVTRTVSYMISGVAQPSYPTGARYDTATRTFSWFTFLGQAGTYSFRFRAVDSGSLSDEKTITITVTATTVNPIIGVRPWVDGSPFGPFMSNGDTYATYPDILLRIYTADPESSAVTLSVTGLSGAVLTQVDTNNWDMSASSVAPGIYTAVFTAVDNSSHSTRFTLYLDVRPAWGRGAVIMADINGADSITGWDASTGPRAFVTGTINFTGLHIHDYWLGNLRSITGMRWRYTIDGTMVGPVQTTSTSYAWDSNSVANGSHLLGVQLLDGPDLTGLQVMHTLLLVNNGGDEFVGPQLLPVTGLNLDNYTSAGVYGGSFAPDWVNYPGEDDHPGNTSHPYTYQYIAPANTLPDPTVLHTPANWFVEPIIRIRSSFHDVDPRFYELTEGFAIATGFWPQVDITTEASYALDQFKDNVDGERDDNDINAYSVFTPDLAGPGWYGVDIVGRFFHLSSTGAVTTLAGYRTVKGRLPYDDSRHNLSSTDLYATGKELVGTFVGTQFPLQFSQPNDLCSDLVDPEVFYIADTMNHRIAKVDTNTDPATVTTWAGGNGLGYLDGAGTVAKFNGPYSIVAAPGGILYVADRWNNAIRKIAADRSVTTLCGGIHNTQILPADPNVLATQMHDHATWAAYQAAADGPFTTASIHYPFRIRLDSAGNIILGESEAFALRKINLTAQTVSLICHSPNGANGEWIAFDVDRHGNIGTVDDIYWGSARPGSGYSDQATYNSNIQRVSADGSFIEDFLRSDRLRNNPPQVNTWGHYFWDFAIDDAEGRMLAIGFGSLGVSSIRIAQPSDPPLRTEDDTAFLRGYQIHRNGTVPGFPLNNRPSFASLHGMHGHSMLGGIPHFDDYYLLSDGALTTAIQAGLGGSVARPEITGNDLRDYLFFIRRSSLQGDYNDVRPGATDADVTAPEIRTVIVSYPNSTTVAISWLTDESTIGWVEYGPTTWYGLASPIESAYARTHAVSITAQIPGLLYHYRVHSKDTAGNQTVSADGTFTGA